jgi:periplasmic copper chaperone A
MRTGWWKASAVVVTAAVAVFGVASQGAAHVVLAPGEAPAGQSTLLTFSFGHGCEGSATTEIRIQLPESIPVVTPTINPGWDAAKLTEALDSAVEGAHGERVTERVAEVVYTAKTPIPDGYRDTFVLSLTLPDTPGETIYFPTIQTCEQGETAWIEIPAEGQDSHDLAAPAPAVTLVEAADGDHSEPREADATTGPTTEATN